MQRRSLRSGITLGLVIGCLFCSVPHSSADPAMQQSRVYTGKFTHKARLEYLLSTPEGYQRGTKTRYPLLVFLHGAGERGTNIQKVAVHGPPKLVKAGQRFPFIIISPQCPEGETWSNDAILGLIDDVCKKYSVDERRIYLTGLSMGGFGSWSLAVEHPERFAAVVPICGGGSVIRILLAEGPRRNALKSLPIWAFHGGKDTVVALEESERMVNALRKLGVREVELTVYPEAGHDSWTEAYNNPKLYEWMLAHERPSRP